MRWLVSALIVGACAPVEWAGGFVESASATLTLWPMIAAAGIALSCLQALAAAVPRLPFEPAVVTVVLLHALASPSMNPTHVLWPGEMVRGDVLATPSLSAPDRAWVQSSSPDGMGSFVTRGPAQAIQDFLQGRFDAQVGSSSIDSVIRDGLPPPEDVVVIGAATPIGMASGVLLLVAGLWGAYRGLVDLRSTLISIISCYLLIVVLPVPIFVDASTTTYRWFASASSAVGWTIGLTFVHYLIFASPAIFVTCVLAHLPASRPVTRGRRYVWSGLLGFMIGVSTLWLSVSYGAIAALMVAQLLTPLFDRVIDWRAWFSRSVDD